MHFWSIFFLLCAFIIHQISTVPIDNGVEGEPEIECGSTGITVNFNTRNNFEGHVYVKGRFAEQGCRSDEGGRRVAGISLPFTACGTERTRSLNPKGVFVRQTVVISFHPQFLTKVDRAYTIQCFYMEADKTVSQQLEVSDITTLFQSQGVPMPVCRYDILDGGPTGQAVKYATIGQAVYHKWTCDTETTDIYCMTVHTCFVDDGSGNRVNLLNEQGCALDKYLLQNLEYATDLMAGREAHVYKYADKAGLFFQCQITITIKEPGSQCPRPQCPEPSGALSASSSSSSVVSAKAAPPAPAPPARSAAPGAPGSASKAPYPSAVTPAALRRRGKLLLDSPFHFYRNKRSAADDEDLAPPQILETVGVVDVRSPVITTLDIDESQLAKLALGGDETGPKDGGKGRGPVCVSPPVVGAFLAFTILSTSTAFFSLLAILRRQKTKL